MTLTTGAHSTDALLGNRIAGRYDVVRHLSTGGMASVYEAIDVQSQAGVALKVLHPHHARRPSILRRFQLEAEAVSGLDTRYVAMVNDSGDWDGIHYLVMDLLVGEDLRQVFQRTGRLTIPQAVDMALDVCRGLRSAHARGLVHRDVKPSNIFIAQGQDGSRRAKLLDFGIAKYAKCGDSTDESTLLGTLGYMAPEQVVSSKRVDHRADIYSLGLVLYEALCGTPAYGGERTEVLYEIVHGHSVSIEDFDGELPRGLALAIVKATARDPETRHGDVQALASAIAPFAGSGFLCPDWAYPGYCAARGFHSPRKAVAAQLANTQPDTSSESHALAPNEVCRRASPARRRHSATVVIATVLAAGLTAAILGSSSGNQQISQPLPASTLESPRQATQTSVSPLPAVSVSRPPGRDGTGHGADEAIQTGRILDAVAERRARPKRAPKNFLDSMPGRDTSPSRILPRSPTSERARDGAVLVIEPGAVFASEDPYDAR